MGTRGRGSSSAEGWIWAGVSRSELPPQNTATDDPERRVRSSYVLQRSWVFSGSQRGVPRTGGGGWTSLVWAWPAGRSPVWFECPAALAGFPTSFHRPHLSPDSRLSSVVFTSSKLLGPVSEVQPFLLCVPGPGNTSCFFLRVPRPAGLQGARPPLAGRLQ